MITRHRTWFPVYGALPNAYGMPANNACPLVFMWSMQAALELGAFAYARGVLHNHLRYYVTPHGFRYRGGGYIGFGWIAMYVEYTDDAELVMQVCRLLPAFVGVLLVGLVRFVTLAVSCCSILTRSSATSTSTGRIVRGLSRCPRTTPPTASRRCRTTEISTAPPLTAAPRTAPRPTGIVSMAW